MLTYVDVIIDFGKMHMRLFFMFICILILHMKLNTFTLLVYIIWFFTFYKLLSMFLVIGKT